MTTPAASPGSAALLRLAQSRARLLEAWQQDAAATGGKTAPGSPRPAPMPATDWLLEWMRGTWRQHPWQGVAGIAAIGARQVLQPLALRHPLLLVLGAAAAGAAVVSLRPKRWLTLKALWAGVLPPLVRAVVVRWTATAMGPLPPA